MGNARLETWLTERFDLEVPLVGAPMAGAGGGRLAGAISAAGGLGLVPAGPATTAATLTDEVRLAAETAHGRPYGIGLMAWALPDRPEQLAAVLDLEDDLRPAMVSVSFGDVTPYVEPLRDKGFTIAAQAGTADEAAALEAAGVDLLVARGGEAGGHGRDDVATLPLLQQVLDTVSVPVLAAGGISGPRGLAAVLAAGAAGAWVGTAFLTTHEALTAPALRERLLAAGADGTAYGRVFDIAQRVAWPKEYGGRALRNPFFDQWVGHEDELATDDPAHEAVVRSRKEADPDIAPVYAGQGVGVLNAQRPAAEVVADFARAAELLRRW